MPRKAARKAPASGRPFTKDDPRINRTKPGPGRPKDEWKELCRSLVSHPATISQVADILEDRTDPKFVAAARWLSENGYGKPDGLSIDDLYGKLVAQTEAIRSLLEPEQAETLVERLSAIWQ